MPIGLNELAIVLILGGIVIRLFSSRRYVDAYARVHSAAPPRSWLWSRDHAPDVERARIPLAIGSVLAILGLGVLLLSLIVPRAG